MDDDAQVTESTPEPVQDSGTTAPDTGATDAAPTPAPEPEPVSPEWLDAPRDTTSHGYHPEPQGPPIDDPGYYQRQGQPPQRRGGIDFGRFVENPEAVLEGFMAERLGPYMSSLMQQQQQQQVYQQQMIHSQVTSGQSAVRNAIHNAYKNTFSKDPGFTGNKEVKQRVERQLQERYNVALQNAQYGDFRELGLLQNPEYYGAVLTMAKYLAGYRDASPPVVGTATTERPNTQSVMDGRELDADTEAALSRMGPGAKERYLKALKEYGDDIEFWD